jgi:GNAT superfamily N-acetyltransferase
MTAKSPSIRPATLHDAAEIARLSTQLGYPATEGAMRERLEQLLPSPRQVVFVAEAGHGLLGWVAGELRLILESGSRVELAGLVVDASARRTGIGSQLVREVEQWALAKCRGCISRTGTVVQARVQVCEQVNTWSLASLRLPSWRCCRWVPRPAPTTSSCCLAP